MDRRVVHAFRPSSRSARCAAARIAELKRFQSCKELRPRPEQEVRMTTRIWSGTCVAISFGLVAGLMAQAPAPQTSPQSNASATAKTMMVTGCVERGPQSPTGTSGTAGAASAATQPKFVLTNAEISPSGASGTSGSATQTPAAATQYRLDGADAKLTPHVGHKVQIDGTLQEASASATSSGGSSASASTTPTLKVDDVKMLASTCP
jgi:hypothetical protein